MKKNIIVALFLVGVGASFGAVAAPIVSGEAITPVLCPVLGENVSLNMSKNNVGDYKCDEATNTIRVGACNTGGSRTPLTVQCAITSEAGVTPVTYNGAGCAGTATTDTFVVSNYRGYIANSKGGSVAVVDLGGACTASTITAKNI